MGNFTELVRLCGSGNKFVVDSNQKKKKTFGSLSLRTFIPTQNKFCTCI